MEFLFAVGLLATGFSLIQTTTAHSWNEQLSLAGADGNFIANGYPRGYMARTDVGYNGNSMMWMLPSIESKRTQIDGTDFLCHTSQRAKNQTANYPRLQVTPGSTVAMKYLENGHVTQPTNQKGKQPSGGSVFVFGTTQPKDDQKIVDVLQWTADGTGGDKSGRLLAAQNFDDGRCYQINSSPISTQRQQQFPNHKPGQNTGAIELWCETTISLPKDIPTGEGAYTVYWLWDWRTLPASQSSLALDKTTDPSLPMGKEEYYSTCSDFDVMGQPPAPAPDQHTLQQQDPMQSGLPPTRTGLIANPSAEPSPNHIVNGANSAAPAPPSSPAAQVQSQAAPSNAMTTPNAPQKPAPTPAASSVSPLGLNAFKPAPEPSGAAASPAPPPSVMTSPSPAPSSGMKVLTVPANAPVYQISGGSLVPLPKRTAAASPTTMATLVRRWGEGYSVEERSRLAQQKREESSGQYKAFGHHGNGTVHSHAAAHNATKCAHGCKVPAKEE